MKNKETVQVFNYSWCGENRSILNGLSVADIKEDSILLCGQTGYSGAYTESNVSGITVMELTKASTNPHAGKTIMELYVPYGYVNEKISDAINKYNATSSDYFIEVSGRYTDNSAYNYGNQIANDDELQTVTLNGDAKIGNKLAMDLLNGEGPDSDSSTIPTILLTLHLISEISTAKSISPTSLTLPRLTENFISLCFAMAFRESIQTSSMQALPARALLPQNTRNTFPTS